MYIKLKKAFNDLRLNPGRMVLLVLALVIGFWGVGSILVSYAILSNDLIANYLSTVPMHAALTSGDFGKLDLAALRNLPGIEKAELRDFASLRIETYPDEWIPLWLFGVQNFNGFELARIFDGAGSGNPVTPPAGSVLIERDGLKFSDLQAGLTGHVRAGGVNVDVPVAGICFDPAQAPGTQDHLIYAYADKNTFTQISGQPANRRLIVRFKNVHSRDEVEAAAAKLTAYFDSLGIATDTAQIPKFNEHPHQWQLDTLLFLVGSIGFLAFFMGAVLVSQLMSAILAKQVRQIGILKAIGAARFKIMQIYLGMVLVFAAVSGVIAVPLAINFGYGYAYFVAYILNFEILTTSLPAYVYFYLIAAVLLLPVLLSLPTILRGTALPVREAVSDYGIRPTVTKPFLGGKIPFSSGLAMAFRNVLRRKKRLAVTVAAMALGVAIFSSGFNLQQSVKNILLDADAAMQHDVQVVLSNPVPEEQALAWFRGIGNISRIETWNGGRGAMQSGIVAADDGIGIVALPYDTDLIRFQHMEGRWLSGSREPEIVLNQEAAALYGNPAVGSYRLIRIKDKPLKVRIVGIVNEADRAKIYMDKELYDEAANPAHLVNSLMFVARDKNYDELIALKKAVERAIRPSDLPVLYVLLQAERVQIIYDHLLIVLITLIFFALVVLVVSAMGMASAVGINILERTREIGVLRAIGATPKVIKSLLIKEGLIISTASLLLGLLLSWPVSAVASGFFGSLMLEIKVIPSFNWAGLAVTLVFTLAFGWVASRFPARGAVKISARAALAYE